MTLDRIIKQAMRPDRGRLGGGPTETEERSDKSNLRFQAYHIIITVSFSRRSTFHCVFPLFYSILASDRPSLPSIPSLCPHRFRFLAAASLSFNFRFCMLFALSLPRSCLVAATPHLLLLVAYSRFIGFSAADFFSAIARSFEHRFSKIGEMRTGVGRVGTTISVTQMLLKLYTTDLALRKTPSRMYSNFRNESEREGERV